VAYQGVGRGLGLDRVLELNLEAVGGLLPDRTFLLLLDPTETHTRLTGDHDRLEREGEEFRAQVDAGYRELAARFPERILALDGSRPPETIAEEVYGALRVRS
jgi:dTMP kinase